MKKNNRRVSRLHVRRAVRNAAVAGIALVAAVQTSSAVLPNVANAVSGMMGMKLFISSDSPAQRQADAWRRSRPADAVLMDRIAKQPVAKWMGNWNTDVRRDVASVVSRATSQGTAPVFV
ncbi:MAG: hypothetical protein WD801_04315, partial [Gemmatimonadaceae bacterium]